MFSVQTNDLVPEIELWLGDHIIDMWLKLGEDKAPHWAFAWPGGLSLARFTLDTVHNYQTVENPVTDKGTVIDFTDSNVTDVGCGSGINTVAALMAGAKTVNACDWNDRSRALTVKNVVRYLGGDTVTVEENGTDTLLSTDTVAVHVTHDIQRLDLIDIMLMGDVFYESADLMTVADEALSKDITVLMGDPGHREYFPQRRAQLLASYTVPGMQLLESRDRVPGHVYRYLPEG